MDAPLGVYQDGAPEVQPFLTEGDDDPFAYHPRGKPRGERRETPEYFHAGRDSRDGSPDFKRRTARGRRSNSVESNVSLGEVDFSRPAVEAAIKDSKQAHQQNAAVSSKTSSAAPQVCSVNMNKLKSQ